MAVLVRLILFTLNSFPDSRRYFWVTFFNWVAAVSDRQSWTFMNYGYEPLDGDGNPPQTDRHREQVCTRLYAHVLQGAITQETKVLEIGCGRGGGLRYVVQAFAPAFAVGLDLARKSIEFCARSNPERAAHYVTGHSEYLPFANAAFDVVVNVESSFCYPSFEDFLGEVARVLKPGGLFCIADLRWKTESADFIAALHGHSELDIVSFSDISQNVRKALDRDAPRREQEIRQIGRPLLRHVMETFAGLPGTRIYEGLRSGEMQYFTARLRRRP